MKEDSLDEYLICEESFVEKLAEKLQKTYSKLTSFLGKVHVDLIYFLQSFFHDYSCV